MHSRTESRNWRQKTKSDSATKELTIAGDDFILLHKKMEKPVQAVQQPAFEPAYGIQPVLSPDVAVEAGSGNGNACREVGLQELPSI